MHRYSSLISLIGGILLAIPAHAQHVLTKIADVPMPGPAVRFDYQSFDPASGRLYIAHMNADQLVVFDTASRKVVANLEGFQRVHGVTVAGPIHRVYVSATGRHDVVALDAETLKIVGRAGPIDYPGWTPFDWSKPALPAALAKNFPRYFNATFWVSKIVDNQEVSAVSQPVPFTGPVTFNK